MLLLNAKYFCMSEGYGNVGKIFTVSGVELLRETVQTVFSQQYMQ
jgi:hypothetical protein